MELIKHYAKISTLRYELSMSDLLYSGGDITKTDVTMNTKISNGELSKVDIFTYKCWLIIKNKIPSMAYKNLEFLAKIVGTKRDN
jgi:hypothetical protein